MSISVSGTRTPLSLRGRSPRCLWRQERSRLRGGVFAAEEGLIEDVDASVQGAHILADFGDVLLDASVSRIDRTPKS